MDLRALYQIQRILHPSTFEELALEIGGTSETLVEGRTFPEDGGYYKKRVDLPGFADLGFCVLDFAKKIPEKIVEEVVDSAKVNFPKEKLTFFRKS